MSENKEIWWAYISELFLTTLLFGSLLYFFDLAAMSKIFRSSASDIATYFAGIMLAGSIAFLWAFYSKSDTAFSKWLYEKGAFNIYLTAYVIAIAVYVVLLFLLILCAKIDSLLLTMATIWFFILGLINVYTFIRNIIGQLLLNMEFNRVNERKS